MNEPDELRGAHRRAVRLPSTGGNPAAFFMCINLVNSDQIFVREVDLLAEIQNPTKRWSRNTAVILSSTVSINYRNLAAEDAARRNSLLNRVAAAPVLNNLQPVILPLIAPTLIQRRGLGAYFRNVVASALAPELA